MISKELKGDSVVVFDEAHHSVRIVYLGRVLHTQNIYHHIWVVSYYYYYSRKSFFQITCVSRRCLSI